MKCIIMQSIFEIGFDDRTFEHVCEYGVRRHRIKFAVTCLYAKKELKRKEH